jgi:hypothetical protein
LDGKVFESDKLPVKNNWVLVYVRPDCRACDAIFGALGDGRASRPTAAAAAEQREVRRERAEKTAAAAAARAGTKPGAARAAVAAAPSEPRTYFSEVQDATQKLIIVVGGATVEEAKRMAAEMPWIPQGSWYVDTSREVAAKMKWQSAPVVAGISGGAVKWCYVGVPPEGLPLRSLMSDWHEGRGETRQQTQVPHQ